MALQENRSFCLGHSPGNSPVLTNIMQVEPTAQSTRVRGAVHRRAPTTPPVRRIRRGGGRARSPKVAGPVTGLPLSATTPSQFSAAFPKVCHTTVSPGRPGRRPGRSPRTSLVRAATTAVVPSSLRAEGTTRCTFPNRTRPTTGGCNLGAHGRTTAEGMPRYSRGPLSSVRDAPATVTRLFSAQRRSRHALVERQRYELARATLSTLPA